MSGIGTPALSSSWQATQPVSVADGSDVTLGTKADAKSTATDTTAVSVMSVLKEISYMEQTPASRAVTNAGTFAVQAAQSGAWNIGTVTTLTGITNVVHVDDNSGSLTIDNAGLTTADLDTGAGTDTRGVQGIALGKSGGALILDSGQQTMANSLPVVLASDQSSLAVTGTFWQATQPVSIADGSDATLGAKADAKSTATDTTAVTIMSVLKEISYMEQTPASRAVTNAGTFATQATLQTQTDTTMIGGVNVKEINGVAPTMGNGVVGTGVQRVTIASDSTGQVVLATGTAEIGNVKNSGTFATQSAQSGTWTVQPGNTQNTTPWLTSSSASTAAVGTLINVQTAFTNTKVQVKATATNLYGYHLYNPNSVAIYIQMFNATSASVTLGTTTPDDVLVVPPAGVLDTPAFVPPHAFGTALTVAATTTATGSTAPTTDLQASFYYI